MIKKQKLKSYQRMQKYHCDQGRFHKKMRKSLVIHQTGGGEGVTPNQTPTKRFFRDHIGQGPWLWSPEVYEFCPSKTYIFSPKSHRSKRMSHQKWPLHICKKKQSYCCRGIFVCQFPFFKVFFREVVTKNNGLFTVRLTVRGEGGSPPSALTVSKCENITDTF